MVIADDGVPTNLSPLAKQLLEELRRRPRPALFSLRKSGCRCFLASAYRVDSGDLLLGRRRALVRQSLTAAQARKQGVVLPLDTAYGDFLVSEFSCEHATLVTLPVAEVRAAVAAAAQGRRSVGEDFLL